MKKLLLTTAASVIALGSAALISTGQAKAAGADKEKCYGVAKAGQNDCGNKYAGHSCAGQSTKDGSKGDFIVVPKGLCERLVGSSLEAMKDKM